MEAEWIKSFIKGVVNQPPCKDVRVFVVIESNLSQMRTTELYNHIQYDLDMNPYKAVIFPRMYNIMGDANPRKGFLTTEETKHRSVKLVNHILHSKRMCVAQKPYTGNAKITASGIAESMLIFNNQLKKFHKEPIKPRDLLTSHMKYTYSGKKSCGKDDMVMAFLIAVFSIDEFYSGQQCISMGYQQRIIAQTHGISNLLIESHQELKRVRIAL